MLPGHARVMLRSLWHYAWFECKGPDMQVFIYQPPSLPWLDIRYADEHIVIINKPSGLLSNPGIAAHTHDCALTRLQQMYAEVHLVHRLDCDTSGVMVFARSKAAEIHLKKQFEGRDMQKTYVALVQGDVQTASGEINAPLLADPEQRPLQKVAAAGKKALTYFEVLEHSAQRSRLLLKPVTGRTHQLRVHLQYIGHTILGDNFYGDAACRAAAPRLCLHAQSLTLQHPHTAARLTFSVHADF